jgi:hypothetical protein
MVMNVIGAERCAVCGAKIEEALAFCHFYPEERRVTLCTPACAEDFLRGSTRAANEVRRRDLIEELLEERRWASWR